MVAVVSVLQLQISGLEKSFGWKTKAKMMIR